MTKTSVRIGAFEIDDAELRGEAQGERTVKYSLQIRPGFVHATGCLGCRYQRTGNT